MRPLISVILSFYNAQDYIANSLSSILNQTVQDFELIVINDGSIDNTVNLIESVTDKRIVYVENKKNQGLIRALNRGLFLSRGQFIVRMDADDECLPTRFEKQLQYFESNGHIDILGTQQYIIGRDEAIRHSLTHEEIRVNLLTRPGMAHSSIMMKKESLTGNGLYYDRNAVYAEDYKLWVDSTLTGLILENLDEDLCGYRFHSNQVSAKWQLEQTVNGTKIKLGYAKSYFADVLAGNERTYLKLINGIVSLDTEKMEILAEKLVDRNRKCDFFDKYFFEDFLINRLLLQLI